MSIAEKFRGIPLYKRVWKKFIYFLFPQQDKLNPVTLIYAEAFWVTFWLVLVTGLLSLVLFDSFPAKGENTTGPYLLVMAAVSYAVYRMRRKIIPYNQYWSFKSKFLISASAFLLVPYVLISGHLGLWLDKHPDFSAYHFLLMIVIAYLWARGAVVSTRLLICNRYLL